MQRVIVEKPYQFIPPLRRDWLSKVLLRNVHLHSWYIRIAERVISHEVRHIERLRRSLEAGHGILICPNHSRTADPVALGWLCELTPCLVYAMASWHLFHQGWLSRWIIRTLGAFSVNREGTDRRATAAAVEILVKAERPLVIFPEGATSRTNDQLHPFLDGIGGIARLAAKRRARINPPGKVIIHPLAIKYHLVGDVDEIADKTLSDIERRLSWRPQRHLPLPNRIIKVGRALLALKEMEYLGESCTGPVRTRLQALAEHLLNTLEKEWFGQAQPGATMHRVRVLRSRILPDMALGRVSVAEHERRWQQLEDLYLVQQLVTYVPDYVACPSVDRLLEMVEKFEEDLTDKVRYHPPLHCVLDMGEPIEVAPGRFDGNGLDPLLGELGQRLQGMLDRLASESRLYVTDAASVRASKGEL